MIALLLGLVLLGLLFGGRRLTAAARAALVAWSRRPLSYWRPASGLGAVALMTVATVLLVREDWLPALVCLLVAATMALSARRRRTRPGVGADSASGPRPTAAPPASAAVQMSEREARAMLGVGDEAGADEIEAAYRRLIRRVHPDLGGAAGLAAQLNAARARLQRER